MFQIRGKYSIAQIVIYNHFPEVKCGPLKVTWGHAGSIGGWSLEVIGVHCRSLGIFDGHWRSSGVAWKSLGSLVDIGGQSGTPGDHPPWGHWESPGFNYGSFRVTWGFLGVIVMVFNCDIGDLKIKGILVVLWAIQHLEQVY